MEYPFGHGFVTSIILIAQHFALPPEQAWFGVGDHVEGLVRQAQPDEREADAARENKGRRKTESQTEQEAPDYDDREQGAQKQAVPHAADGGTHQIRLVVEDLGVNVVQQASG